jgi:hypothetical protein
MIDPAWRDEGPHKLFAHVVALKSLKYLVVVERVAPGWDAGLNVSRQLKRDGSTYLEEARRGDIVFCVEAREKSGEIVRRL